MNIGYAISDSCRKKLQDTIPEVAETADSPKEQNPLAVQTKKSLKEHNILFKGSRRTAIPRHLFFAFSQLFKNYQAEINALYAQKNPEHILHLRYTLQYDNARNLYTCPLKDGSTDSYTKHNAKLSISLYHDYLRNTDCLRLTLSHSGKNAHSFKETSQTYTIPANEALRDFYQRCQQYKTRQAARRDKRRHNYLQPTYLSFVAFDLERTGTAKGEPRSENKIIEIGAVKVINGKITEHFEQLVNPHKPLLYHVTRLTGIKKDMLKGQPSSPQAVQDFLDFVGDHVLIGHSLDDNDLPPIRQVAKRLKIPFRNKHYDTFRLAQSLAEKHSFAYTNLEYLAEKFNVQSPNAHRAMDDAEATAKVYLKLRELYYTP